MTEQLQLLSRNPLERTRDVVTSGVARAASLTGRVAAAAIAISVAFDQSYDRTQVFTVALAVVLLASLVPIPERVGAWTSPFACALVLFAGAMLFNVGAGWALVPLGAAAGAAEAVTPRTPSRVFVRAIAAVVVGCGVTVAAVAVIALLVEG
jgi:hypothetical protein